MNEPDEQEAVKRFKEIYLKRIAHSLSQKKDEVIKEGNISFKFFDPDKDIITLEQTIPDDINKAEKDAIKATCTNLKTKSTGIYDLKFKAYTKEFLKITSKGVVEQFKSKADFLKERLNLIENAPVYTFKDDFVSLLIQNNKNDWGYRPMPRENIWIEVGLQFGDVFVSGIHLHKVFLKEEGDMSYQLYSDDIIPIDFKEEGISIFVTGISGEQTFYSYFTLGKIGKIELQKSKAKYVCPYCTVALKNLEKKIYYCDEASCVPHFQKNVIKFYDFSNKKIRHVFRVLKFNNVWNKEDNVRNFVSNFLDFINNPEVVVKSAMSSIDLEKTNKKRIKRGKAPLMPMKIIEVDGHLKRYVSLIKTNCRNNLDLARNETWVDGHFFRFWDRDKWCRLYEAIKGLKLEGDIKERLTKIKRRDDKGNILPPSQQYLWDDYYKVMKVWKLPFLKFKGEGDPVDRVKVLKE